MAYGPAAEVAAGTEAAAQDGNGSEAQTVESGEEEAAAQPAAHTEEDLYVMAHVLAGECQSCPDQEQLYVGSVVLNRKIILHFQTRSRELSSRKDSIPVQGTEIITGSRRSATGQMPGRFSKTAPCFRPMSYGSRAADRGKGVYVKTRWHYYCY